VARPARVETAVVVRLGSTTATTAVLTRSGAHLLRGREVLGYLTERELDKLAAEWVAFRERPPAESG
jgi:hypothetical protein